MECIADHKNTIVLALATCGGFVLDKGSRKLINIAIQRKSKDGLDENEFLQFEASTQEYREILEDANTLRQEINCLLEHEAEVKKKHEEDLASQQKVKNLRKDPAQKKKRDSSPESLFRYGDDEPDNFDV